LVQSSSPATSQRGMYSIDSLVYNELTNYNDITISNRGTTTVRITTSFSPTDGVPFGRKTKVQGGH
jgi:hypothetical protein